MYPYRRREKPARSLLALGDLVVIVSLVTFGTFHHGRTDFLHALYVAAPFVVGWFTVAPLADAYGDYPSTRNEFFATLGTWMVAALVGLGLRSTQLFPGGSPPSFGFVMIVVVGSAVVLWRLVVLRLVVLLVRLTR